MRRAIALLLATTLLLPGLSAPAKAHTRWRPRMDPAAEYAQARDGSVSIAVMDTEGRMHRWRGAGKVPMASVLKVMFMVAYLRQPAVRDRKLRDADRDLLRPMIRRSDNDSATTIANRLGPKPLYRLARRADMHEFSYTRPWGLSTTSARDQARFMARLRRHIPNRHEPYAMGLLNDIVPSQRWGIGKVDTPRWRKHFKGGWGSGTGWVDHQVVRLQRRDGTRVGLAVMVRNSPSHTYGKRTLRGVFARLLRDLPET
ncbi:MAG: serine hydrolase [Egibacteraceae bacterium]